MSQQDPEDRSEAILYAITIALALAWAVSIVINL